MFQNSSEDENSSVARNDTNRNSVFLTKSVSQPSVVKTTAAILLHPPLLDRYIPFKYSKGLLIFSRDHFVASSLSELQ